MPSILESVTDDVTYELHGVGCSVYLSDVCVDFDYGRTKGSMDSIHGDVLLTCLKHYCNMPKSKS